MPTDIDLYFYSGCTPMVAGQNSQFCGLYAAQIDTPPTEVYNEILCGWRAQWGSDVVLTAFNKVPQ
jgi:hypothetical protein